MHLRSLTTQTLAVLAMVIGMAALARAQITVTITLDDFDYAQYLDTGTNNPESSTVTDGSLLGGERVIELWTTTGTIFNRLRTATYLGNTDLMLSTEIGDSSISTVTYDGTDASGLNSFDVTAGGGTHFYMRMDQLDGTANWKLNLGDMGGGTEEVILALNPGSSDILMPFSDFSIVDLTDLKSIAFTLESTGASGGLDFALDSFGAAMIPEPSTGLLVAGALGFGILLRRRHHS